MSREDQLTTASHHEGGVAVHEPDVMQHQPPPIMSGALLTVVAIVLIAAALLAAFGIVKRLHAPAKLSDYTRVNAAPPVLLQEPILQKSAQEIVLPGTMQAFTLAPIYARTTGYVRSWSHDIGSFVHKGDLLAVIETPELDQELAQAKADLATAKTNASLAKVTAGRYQDLIGNNAVSQQDTDNAISQLQ